MSRHRATACATRRIAARLSLALCALASAIACARASSGTPAVVAPAPGTPGTSIAPPACCAEDGHRIAARYRVAAIASRRFGHEALWRALDPLVRAPGMRGREVGRSAQGRAIRSVTWGHGPVTVLLWSQMHGDESTATMALADVMAWLASPSDRGDPIAAEPLRRRLDSALTLVMVPMLNPDGAELFQRENAAGVDVNRDARALATPEARALKALHERLHPAFGFNLHDQGARTLAGAGGPPAAIALLAPAADVGNSWGPVRSRARQVAATVAAVLAPEIPGRVAKYNDAHEPRAFGDLMQQWGTSTVLIESGVLPDDAEKQRLRTLNVVALLTALDAIATGTYAATNVDAYERLPTNRGAAVDVLVRGGTLVLPGMAPMRADLALNYEDAVARRRPRLRDVGDLQAVVAIDTVEATGLFVHPAASMLTERGAGKWLQIGAAGSITVRRGAKPGSAVVRVIGGE